MKKLLTLLISVCFALTGFSQQDKTDHLLWFKGKLIKPNVLLTPAGDTVSYNPKTQQVKRVSKSGVGKKFDGMLAELNRTSKRIDEAVKQMSKTLPPPLLPGVSAAVTQGYTDAEKTWKPLLGNTYTLPEGNFKPVPKMINGKGGVHDLQEEEDEFEEILKRMRAFIMEHKDDNLESLLPVPPRANFSYCYPCDSIAKERYESEKSRFLEEIMAVDDELHTEALKMCQYIQVTYGDVMYKPGNEKIRQQHDEAWAFHDMITQRGAKKAVLLLDKYKNDPYRVGAIMEFVLKTDRELQIMGIRDETAFANVDYWPEVMSTLNNFFFNAFKEKDYTIGLNIRGILGHERMNQLMGLSKGGPNLLEELMKFNQFKLNSNITAKLGKEDGYIMGHVRGDNWFHAIPDRETCRLNWILAITTIDRTAKYKLLAAEMVGAPVYYVGTKDWQSQPPLFKMDFCHKEGEEVADSIMAHTFHPEGFREQWKYPDPTGVMEVEQVSGTLMICFLDVEEAKKIAEQFNKEKIEKMKKDMQDKYKNLATGNVQNMSALSVKMQEDMEKLNKEIKELLLKTNPLKYIFTPQVNNKTSGILKERLDGKEIFPENGAIQYAWFHLTMDHDPDGPHPISPYTLSTILQW